VIVTNANTAFSATGLSNSFLKNFVFTKGSIAAATIGTFDFTKDWKFNEFSISVTTKAIPLNNAEGIENEERLK
jgi:hypothetical protein